MPETAERRKKAGEAGQEAAPGNGSQEPQPVDDRTIHQRMVAILGELPAIGKNQRNTQQNFNFRGHDDVLNALTPLLAQHGVVILPNVVERLTAQRNTARGGIMYEVNLHIEFTFYGAMGDSVVASAWGEGTDMGDKATMKAGTMAFKAALNQSFAINTEEGAKHDADKGTPEETYQPIYREKDPGPKPPANWADALKRFDSMTGKNGDAAAWLGELLEKKFDGATTVGSLNTDDRKRLAAGFFSTLMELEDRHGDLAFVRGQRAIIAGAFAEKNDGIKLNGPAWPLDETEAGAFNEKQEAKPSGEEEA